MGGFIFRLGQSLKDWGERLRWGWMIRLGLDIRDFIYKHGVFEHGKLKIE